MATAGCSIRRASRRAKSSCSGPAGSSSLMSLQICFSMVPMKGVRTRTVAKRKRVFRKAMLTAFMVALTKPKCTTLFTP